MNIKLIIVGIGALLVAVSFWVNGAFDVQLYDTYYVIGWGLVLRVMGLLGCLVGALYFLGKRSVRSQ